MDRDKEVCHFERQAKTMDVIETFINENSPRRVEVSDGCRHRILNSEVTRWVGFENTRLGSIFFSFLVGTGVVLFYFGFVLCLSRLWTLLLGTPRRKRFDVFMYAQVDARRRAEKRKGGRETEP